MLGGLANYHGQLAFIVNFTAATRDWDRIKWVVQRVACFDKEHRIWRDCRSRFCRMFAVVEPDAQDVGRHQRREKLLDLQLLAGDIQTAKQISDDPVSRGVINLPPEVYLAT